MTIWSPEIGQEHRPKYIAIANAIARDVAAGRLLERTRLPTHRELADQLGVTVGTVSRGYEEARRRGLVTGEVGRGTYVCDPGKATASFSLPECPDPELMDLSFAGPDLRDSADLLAQAVADFKPPSLASLLRHQPQAGVCEHRQAGAKWLKRSGLEVCADDLFVTVGAQHALLLTMAVLAEPGGSVMTGMLTYPGFKNIARLLHFRLEGLALDEQGICPEAFEHACKTTSSRVLYCMPNLSNPTATVMSERRRQELGTIATRYGVAIVEDDVYGFLLPTPATPLVTYVPQDKRYFATSLSKAVAPGLRVGYLHAPRASKERLTASMVASTMMASSFSSELATQLIEDETVDVIVKRRRREAQLRRTVADRLLGQYIATISRPEGFHFWLELPDGWRAEEFVSQARDLKLVLPSPELYTVGRAGAPHATRVSLTALGQPDLLERSMSTLARLLASRPTPRCTSI